MNAPILRSIVRPSVWEAAWRVCMATGMTITELAAQGRKAVYSERRAIIAYVLHEVHGASYPEIARVLGLRNHTSAMAARRRCDTDSALVRAIVWDESARLARGRAA